MASRLVLLLQLLLVSLVSASHYNSGKMSFTYVGKNPDGSIEVNFREKATFRHWCLNLRWSCYSGNCGSVRRRHGGQIDRGTNSPFSYSHWCETEYVTTRVLPSDKPFHLWAGSCCWVGNRNGFNSWNLLTSVDLGRRSDTGKPNQSPDVGILPFIRVPQNCPRTYKLMSFDPDGDKIRCRYGNQRYECTGCQQPFGFTLDEDSCTLHYHNNTVSASSTVYAFETVVEDFPRNNITLSYSDGSQVPRSPLSVRRKRSYTMGPTTTTPGPTPWWWWWQPTTTAAPTTTTPTPTPWWWWWQPTTTAAPTTTTPGPTPWWWWWQPTTTAVPTTTTPGPTPWWWWRQPTTAAAPTTTTPGPTPNPGWWWWRTTTTAGPTTTQGPTPWWWWRQPTTTAVPTTTTPGPTPNPGWWWRATTTAGPTTTQGPTPTPWQWWWWQHTTTTTRPTTTPGPGSNSPLSKLPLQFSFLVDAPAPSCQEGQYLPKLVHPTPRDGARIQAEVNKEMEIRVKAQASHSTIRDVHVTGPLNISYHRTTHEEFVIEWTPMPEDLGQYYAVCFVVESVSGYVSSTRYIPQSGLYHSEMRCVLVNVVQMKVNSNVICSETSMTVEIERSSFSRISEDHLQLNDPTNTICSLRRHSNSTHVIAVIPLNACGTQIEEDDENLIFRNEITTVDNTSYVITRRHLLSVQVCCQYPKHGNVTQSFTVHRDNVTVWEKGFGKFTYGFEFFTNSQYGNMFDPNSYPLEYDVGSDIFMQIEATSSINNTQLFVESCRASPYDNPNSRPKYTIIENGCKVDSTVQIYTPAHNKQFRFSIGAFKFIGAHDQVYISCSVMMCEAGASNTRCSQGCLNSTMAARRRKREAVTQSSMHLVSQGPLRLRRSAEYTDRPGMNLNLNLVFIAGCLLAAVGMISAVVAYKAKMSKVKYQPLPTAEN